MSIQPPQGILTIPNATLRVGRLQVDEVKGFDTVLNTFDKNTILEEDSEEYDDDKKWGVKMPNIFVATFEIKGAGSSFNFRNTSMGDAEVGYTLTFNETTLTLKYNGSQLGVPATIPDLDTTYGKVYLTYEKQYFTVTVDGTRVLSYKDTGTRTFPDGEYINFFAGGDGGFKNLKVVAGHLISDGTSNVSLYGGLAVTSNLEVGSSNLFVDTVNSRVGMGTTTPEATLHVSGNAYVSSNLEVGTANLFVDTVNSRVGVGTDTPKESLDVVGNMHLTRVSNVSQIKVDSNVVTEYTGPHDRPLRKYPEVPLTANDNSSTSGYVASVSSKLTGTEPYHTLDGNLNSYLHSRYPYYSTSTGVYSPGSALDGQSPSGTLATNELVSGHQGEWVSIELPKKIKLEKLKVIGSTRLASGITQFPKDVVVAVSETGLTGSWSALETATLISQNVSNHSDTINITTQTSYYKYFALIVKSINSTATFSAVEIAELEFYGHEEGSGSLDTTLKSVYNVPAITGTQLEVYYDAKETSSYSGSGTTVTDLALPANNGTLDGIGFDTTYKAFTFDGTNDKIDAALTGVSDTGTYTTSMWIKSTSIGNSAAPEEIVYQFGHGTVGEGFGVAIKGGNIGTYIFAGQERRTTGTRCISNEWFHATFIYTSNGSMDIYINGVLDNGTLSGTLQELTIPSNPFLTLGVHFGGEQTSFYTSFFNGSIANFRLYSKVLNADQVKELYDYQKDYFLGSKSQVTLYKGHLGVGVTEPSGQLELAGDERIQEYPPGPMSDYETLIPGHGVFCAYASSGYTNGSNQNRLAYNAFDKASGSGSLDDIWQSVDSLYNGGSGTNQSYTGSVRLAENLPKGHYLGLKMPYPVKITSFVMGAYFNSGYRAVGDGLIVGRNTNNPTWEVVHTLTNSFMAGVNGFNIAANAPANLITTPSITIDNTKYYDEYALVVTGTLGSSLVTVSEWRLFGTPGPTTLDKGSLSLGRSLDVPRISRYDVDTETPRPEKLVVDFDTTVNSTPTDISGRGNHGTMTSGVSYSAADKAFKWDNISSNRRIQSTITNTNGSWPHSTSFWFKASTLSQYQVLYGIVGDPDGTGGSPTNYSSPHVILNTTGSISMNIWGDGSSTNNGIIQVNRWYHISIVYDSTASGRTLYLDGVRQPMASTGSQNLSMVDTTSRLVIGVYPHDLGTYPLIDGQISNFKLYNVALEPSEVQKLYRLGRTGRSMVISDTAVGIGKVPEAQLDVRGVANFGSRVGIGTTSPNKTLDIGFPDSGYPGIRFTHTDTGGIIRKTSDYVNYYTGLEAVIERYADKNVRYGGSNVPEVTHRINLGYSDSYRYNSGYYPYYHEMHFDVMNKVNEGDSTAFLSRIMTLRGNGRVGIGTTNPEAQLHIGPNDNDHIYLASANNGYGWKIDTDDQGNGAVPFRIIKRTDDVDTTVLTIKNQDGNVGIAATDPIAKLHVNGAIFLASENLGTGSGYDITDAAQKTKTYIEFGEAGASNDWCYLRQIGGSNEIELSFDFHDDGNDARFSIRDVQSTANPDAVTSRFRVDGGAVDIPGSLSVAGSAVSSDDRIKYNEVDIPNALNLINQLRPQKYEKLVDVSVEDKRGIWIPSDEEWESVKDDHKYVHEFGFIAQAVRNIPDLAFLVTGEETKMMTTTKTPIEYSNLTTDEQGTYTPSYVYGRKSITQEEYSILTSNVQELYTLEYVKETETQNPLSLNYNGLFVIAIGAIQELKAKNEALETQVSDLLVRVTALENA